MTISKECSTCGRPLPEGAEGMLCLRCLSAAKDTLPPDTGTDRYAFIGIQGRGGMGRVLLVHDERLGREVALKELLPKGVKSAAQLPKVLEGRFLREAKVTGQLEHPAIIPVHELGRRADGTLYYTMKNVRGKTLSAMIGQGAALRERLKLLPHFTALCQAIAYAHSRRVIHRDIKPANVMVGDYGETVVIDWGLAKVRDQEEPLLDSSEETYLAIHQELLDEAQVETMQGEIMGTLAYMPPEQAEGELGKVDERSDVYSLGVVLYELLTGTVPHTGETKAALLRNVLVENAPAVTELESDAPPELAAICHRALEKEPSNRYASAAELADEMERFHSGALVKAYEYRFSHHLRRFVQLHKAALLTGFSVVVALLVLGVISYVSIYQARGDERDAREQEQLMRIAAEKSQYTANIQLARVHLDRSHLDLARAALEECEVRQRHWEWGFYVLQAFPEIQEGTAADSEAQQNQRTAEFWRGAVKWKRTVLRGHGALVYSARFDDTGASIVSASVDSTARIWDVRQAKERRQWALRGSVFTGAWFSVDGAKVVTARGRSAPMVWDAAKSEFIATFSEHHAPATAMHFSPDGRRVVSGYQDGRVTVWDAGTGNISVALAGQGDAVTHVQFDSSGTRVITASVDGTLKTWDSVSGDAVNSVDAPVAEKISSIILSKDLKLVLGLMENGAGKLWELPSWELKTTLPNTGDVAVFSPDNSCVLFTTVLSQDAVVIETATGVVLATLRGDSSGFSMADFAPDGRSIVTSGIDGKVIVWEPLRRGEERRAGLLDGHSDLVYHGAFSPDGSKAISASYDKTARVWDSRTGETLAVLGGHEAELFRARYIAGGAKIVTRAWDSSVKIWDAETYQALQAIPPASAAHAGILQLMGGVRGGGILSLSGAIPGLTSADGKFSLGYADKGEAHIIDLETGRVSAILDGGASEVMWGCFSPDAGKVLTLAMDETVQVWDRKTAKALYRLEGHTGLVGFADFSPDGKRIVTTSMDATAKLWDGPTGKLRASLEGHTAAVGSAHFSPDGRHVVTGSLDGNAYVWEVESGARKTILRGHAGPVYNAVFSPDGKRILATYHGTVKVWNLEGRELAELLLKERALHAIWSPDGHRVLTSFADGTARIWDAARWRDLAPLGGEEIRLEERVQRWREARE
jgi:eukaryotic-like serine/threonine-protein kinase